VQAIVEAAVVRNLHSFVDAYAGAGNFTLPLLAAGLTGESIDCAPAGILAARSVARDRGLPFDGFQVGDAKTVLESFVRNRRTFDFVLLDPPRSGAKDVLSQVLQLRPQLTALIACDPVSLARDLRILIDAGGNVENVVAYDLFPQTHHLETLALVDLP
jgi:23S rRNA (uracil1939-C5)-methyltransferase